MKTTKLAGLVLLFAPLWGCTMFGGPAPTAAWQEGEIVDVPSDRVLWKVALLSMESLGFPRAKLDPASMHMVSGWRNSLAPFSKQGYRTQAEVQMVARGPGHWSIQTRVRKEINETIVRPLDLRYAEWTPVADDQESAVILLKHIQSRFDPTLELEDRPEDPVEAWLDEMDEKGR